MRRKALVILTIGACIASMLAVYSVEAQRRRRRGRRRAAAAAAAPNSAAIAKALQPLRWGMTPREVHEHFSKQIRERYRPRIAKAGGAIEEDRLRAQMQNEIRRLRHSYTRFDGRPTGHDTSFIRAEFTHRNRESMLVYRDQNSQNFYFFIRGRLWKWYKAFDASVFQGLSFDQFRAAIQRRFGNGTERTGQVGGQGPQQHWIEWQDSNTRLRAIDQTRFYGFYCLVFEDRGTLGRLAQLRTNQSSRRNNGHALVQSVTLPESGEDNGADEDANVVDRITGRDPASRSQRARQRKRGSNGSSSGSSGN